MSRNAARPRPLWALVLGIALALQAGATAAVARPLHLQLPNGIDAEVYAPEDVLSEATTRVGDRLVLTVAPGLRYELITDPSDPRIENPGSGRFHPMSVEHVTDALAAIQVTGRKLAIRVYILPYPRRQVLDSSAREGMIFLSPGMHPVGEQAVHFTVVHEVGHVYQYRWMPDSDTRNWQHYRELRGITDEAFYHASAVHPDRPHEVFAEDFRFLFGGERANYSGSIENIDLALPDEVAGLSTFLAGLSQAGRIPTVTLASAPNPFNPSTVIRVQFPDTAPAHARLRIVDVQGRAVQALFDGVPAGRALQLHWDGRERGGAQAPSGIYFACLDYEGHTFSTKLLLAK